MTIIHLTGTLNLDYHRPIWKLAVEAVRAAAGAMLASSLISDEDYKKKRFGDAGVLRTYAGGGSRKRRREL